MRFRINRDVSFELTEETERYGTRVDQPCSPDIFEGSGIAINAPREVTFSEGPTLVENDAGFIICGATQFMYDTMGFGSSFVGHVTLVAVDSETHESFSAGVPEHPGLSITWAPPPDDMPKPESDHRNTSIGEYFRVNLASLVTLPAKEAEYTVYAFMGSYRSNTLTVKVVKRQTP